MSVMCSCNPHFKQIMGASILDGKVDCELVLLW